MLKYRLGKDAFDDLSDLEKTFYKADGDQYLQYLLLFEELLFAGLQRLQGSGEVPLRVQE